MTPISPKSICAQVATEARFTDMGAAQFAADVGALAAAFGPYTAKPAAYFRELKEACALLRLPPPAHKRLVGRLLAAAAASQVRCIRRNHMDPCVRLDDCIMLPIRLLVSFWIGWLCRSQFAEGRQMQHILAPGADDNNAISLLCLLAGGRSRGQPNRRQHYIRRIYFAGCEQQ